ncbi:hypothetical protein I316_04059 [Kwoniella heveanensis BCC8398]|uniref:Monooxygenase n=1 Tax=Kwoniella heveanensis BCC8398 TaxID=1296120 RepID=A0A1B9GSU8_9TREE|nr:hypothetical protein I316_04059 [Kwoniella heveanensis BCC8398]
MTYDLPSTLQNGGAMKTMIRKKRVAVIGAGVSGLAAIQQLVEAFDRDEVKGKLELDLVVFESKNEVGGVWLTDDRPKKSIRTHLPGQNTSSQAEEVYSYPPEWENPSPMYQGLRTNLAHDLMSFRGFPFPDDTPLFPDQPRVQAYLEAFADRYNLRQHIRFNTRVERVYLTPNHEQNQCAAEGTGQATRRWTIESASAGPGAVNQATWLKNKEEFDYVCVSNGHYSDGWIPTTPGLSSYPGRLIHSRFFLKAEEFKGKSVLVVGSFASGGDISRLIASLNIDQFSPDGQPLNGHPKDGFTRVWVSSSGTTAHSASSDGPWAKYIKNVPLISHFDPPSAEHPRGLIHFQSPAAAESGSDSEKVEPLDAPEVIIYATGYNFLYPFFKATDAPWDKHKLVDGAVREGEREKGDQWEVGGVKGQGMRGLDDLMLFLEGDRTMAFPVLAYQVVPFPLAQVQARLFSLLWADLLPSFPQHPSLPHNPSNPFSQPTADEVGNETRTAAGEPFNTSSDPVALAPEAAKQGNPRSKGNGDKPRKVMEKMKALVFGHPYEWTYSEFLMSLMAEADKGRAGDIEEHWKKIEDWRIARREDPTLRKRTLGY